MGQGITFVRTKHTEYQGIVTAAATAQEKMNYASQALEIMGKVNPTQDEVDQLVVLVQRLT